MKKIPLTKGKYALVSDRDYAWLNQWNWYAQKGFGDTYYAARSYRINGKKRQAIMHRVICGVDGHNSVEVDHRDGDGLNNQRRNLRVASRNQNQQNRTKRKTNTSGFKGVSPRRNKWRATICADRKVYHLGDFDTPELAAKAYAKAANKLHKSFART